MSEFECTVCCESEDRDFRKVTSMCTHQSTICVECLRKNVEEKVDKQFIEIPCITIGCDKIMKRHDVKNIATKEVFEKYDLLAYKIAIQKIPEFRWCKVPCGAGQIHIGKDKAPVITCESCGEKSCYIHKVIWHADASCEDYEEKKKESDFATRDYISRETKECPGCSIPIQKNEGCDHITCSKCGYEFCYLCLHQHPNHKPTCSRR